jgi:hypothetical protein
VVAAILLLALLPASAEAPKAKASPANQGSWTQPFKIGVVGIHAALLNNGQVLLWYYPAAGSSTEPAVLYNPITNGPPWTSRSASSTVNTLTSFVPA